MDQKVTLESNDGVRFVVELEAVKHSKVIKDMLTNLGQWPNEEGTHEPMKKEDESIPLYEVTGTCLQKIVEWLDHYKDEPELPDDQESVIWRRLDKVPKWDKTFLGKMSRSQIYELVTAANYMNVPGLMEVCCRTIAGWLKNKTPDQIREEFGIENDFTLEEEETIRREMGEAERRPEPDRGFHSLNLGFALLLCGVLVLLVVNEYFGWM